MEFEQKDLVEAIEEGRIVKVPEDYARREGLLILKKAPIATQRNQLPPSYLEKKERERPSRTLPLTEYIKAKPDWREKQVISELVDNFHWQIRYNRRVRGLTRKQLARMINVPEEQIQILESGRLPSNDFILLNKIQKFFNINLRKDGKEFDLSASELMHKASLDQDSSQQKTKSKPRMEDYKDMIGKDIDIIDDED
jgi:ribosome-binding protein aMBF1 (putative translation factor)